MNADTRARFGAALAHLTDGVAGLEALAADEAADLVKAERQELQKVIPPLQEAIGPISLIAFRGQERPPARGKVTPAPAPAPEPPVAPVAPVADRGGAAGLRALALALRDAAMAARDHADALRELAAARPQAPPPAAPEPAPAQPSRPLRPLVRTGEVAQALGVPVPHLQVQIRKRGGLAVGLQLGDWQIVDLSTGPSGKRTARWQQIEAQQAA